MDLPDPIGSLPPEVRERVRNRTQPNWFSPMLATLVDKPFCREGWIFEPKLDGERCLTFCKDKNPRLFSRNRILLNQNYPELIEPLTRQDRKSVV